MSHSLGKPRYAWRSLHQSRNFLPFFTHYIYKEVSIVGLHTVDALKGSIAASPRLLKGVEAFEYEWTSYFLIWAATRIIFGAGGEAITTRDQGLVVVSRIRPNSQILPQNRPNMFKFLDSTSPKTSISEITGHQNRAPVKQFHWRRL
jgi:hypothetical protein